MQNLSIPFIFLVMFAVSNFISPAMYLGQSFHRLPFVLSIIAFVSHIFVSIFKGRPIFRLTYPTFFLLFVVAFAALSSYYISVDYSRSQEYFIEFVKAVLLFLLISNIVSNIRQFKIFLFVLSLGAFFVEYNLVHYPIWMRGRAFANCSTIASDPNETSMLTVYSLPFAFAMFLLSKNKGIKLFLAYAMFTMALGIAEAQSRGGFIALLVVISVSFFYVKGIKNKIIALIICLPILLVFTIRYVPKDYIWRMQEITDTEKDGTGSAQARETAMRTAMGYIVSHPISEYGLWNHSYYLAEVFGHDFSSDGDIFKGSYLAHSFLIQFGADCGWIPLVFYILFIVSLYLCLFKLRKKIDKENKEYFVLVNVLIVSLSGFLVGSTFLPWAYRVFLFYIAGLIVALYNILNSRTKSLGP